MYLAGWENLASWETNLNVYMSKWHAACTVKIEMNTGEDTFVGIYEGVDTIFLLLRLMNKKNPV